MAFSKQKYFFSNKLWKLNCNEFSIFKSLLIKILKVFAFSIKKFKKDQILHKATYLSFFSVLSVVPAVATAFGIAKGFGIENLLETILEKNLSAQQEVLEYILTFSQTLLESTKGGVIATIGLFFTVLVVVRMVKRTDEVFNIIWNVKLKRSFARKFADYTAMIIAAALILVVAGSINLFFNALVKPATKDYAFLNYISPALLFLIKIIPYLLMWGLFALIYYFIPKTHVKAKSAILTGIIIGSIYQLVQWGYISAQFGVGRYNAIYGSLAALPLFLIWMQISWYLILFGVELTYAIQNLDKLENYLNSSILSYNQEKWLTIRLLNKILTSFKNDVEYKSIEQIADELNVSDKVSQMITDKLLSTNLLNKIEVEDSSSNFYTPTMPVEKYTFGFVFDKIDNLQKGNCSSDKEFDNFKKVVKNKDMENLKIIDYFD